MRKPTNLNKRFLIAVAAALALSIAVVGRIVSLRSVQVIDLQMKAGALTPEWTDNEHVSILRTDYHSSTGKITVTPANIVKVREADSASAAACCAEQGCNGRWAAAMASNATEAVWWKEQERWLPCWQYSELAPQFTYTKNNVAVLDLPGAALGTLPDGRFAYVASNPPGVNTAVIDAWNPDSAGVQHLGRVNFPKGMQIFSARMSPDGAQIAWLTYDTKACDTGLESNNRLTRTIRKITGKPLQAMCEVAWLSNPDGSHLRTVTRIYEPGLLMLKYIQDYDEYNGPTGDEISWSCDSQFFAFIRGNPTGKRQLYICKTD